MNAIGIAKRNLDVRDKMVYQILDIRMQTSLETYEENPRLESRENVKHLKETLIKVPNLIRNLTHFLKSLPKQSHLKKKRRITLPTNSNVIKAIYNTSLNLTCSPSPGGLHNPELIVQDPPPL